jgi:hypothetical protein
MSAAAGTADIFFATDFSALARMVSDMLAGSEAPLSSNEHESSRTADSTAPANSLAAVRQRPNCTAGVAPRTDVRVLQSADFLRQYADVARCRTMTGYNPLLEDYTNTRMLLT